MYKRQTELNTSESREEVMRNRNFLDPIINTYKIEAYNNDSTAVVLNMTTLFTGAEMSPVTKGSIVVSVVATPKTGGTRLGAVSYTHLLVTGKVEIVIKKQGYLLHPSMQRREENGKVTLSEVDTKECVAGKDGWFVFNKQRLEEVMNTLSRWYYRCV